MNTPLISVIVPVYNVEKYLDHCVQSIVAQTYTSLEIILVDDGSPDRCPDMCDAWAAKDSRVKVIHKENGGLSDARNAGMAAATGELMGFVDSDDYIAPEMYRLLYENMVENRSDISACGVEMVWEDGTPSRNLTPSGGCVMNREEAMEAIINESLLKQPVWYKLYKTALIRDIPFPAGKCHEDVFWSYQAVGRASKVSVFDTPCYFYLQRRGSIMGSSYSLKRLDALEAKLLRSRYVEENLPSLISADKCDLLFSCIYAMQQTLLHLSGEAQAAAKEKILSIYKSGKPYRKPATLPLKQRVWFYLARLSLPMACILRNLFRIGL